MYFLKAKRSRPFIHPRSQDIVQDYVDKLIQDLWIDVKGGKGEYDEKRAILTTDPITKKQNVQCYYKPEDLHAIILYPSLCMPAVIEPSAPLTMYFLVNDAQMRNIQAGRMLQEKDDSYPVSDLFASAFWLHIHATKWQHRRRLKPSPYFKMHYLSEFLLFKDKGDQNQPICPKERFELINRMHFSEPEVIDPDKVLVLKDERRHSVGRVKPCALKRYNSHGYKYLVRVTFREHELKQPGMYNLTFISMESREQVMKDPGHLSPFQDHQDRLIEEGLTEYRCGIKHRFHIPEQGPFEFELLKHDPIQAYHPVYVVDKPKLGIGHLTDVHVSSRQEAFRKCNLQVIPGAPEEISPKIGDLVNVSLETTQDLLDQMGKNPNVDLLFITGDLVDYNLNLDLSDKKNTLKGFLDIWEYMSLGKHWNNTTLAEHQKANPEKFGKTNTHEPKNILELSHTYGIDDAIIYSLFIYYYDKYQKPIFVCSGNHDSYELPYGISPRVLGINGIKANAGIPMDHNLTFTEALLLFGPEYGTILKNFNFSKEFFSWDYQIFTPLSDFTFKYKSQSFTCVEWGDGEEFMQSGVSGGGLLPRATHGLTYDQIRIIQTACLDNNPKNGDSCILFLHAPIINYDFEKPFFEKDGAPLFGEVIFEKNQADHYKEKAFCLEHIDKTNKGKYNMGSFVLTRDNFFQKFLQNESLSHVFSGHSHRSAIYEILNNKSYIADTANARHFNFPSFNDPEKMERTVAHRVTVRGYPLDRNFLPHSKSLQDMENFLNTSKSKMIVTGSGGPIPVMYIKDELGGEGLAPPSGTILYYDENGKDIIQPVYAKNKRAKPRFAAMLDAFCFKKGDWVFKIEGKVDSSDPNKTDLMLFINQSLPRPSWIKSIKLYFPNSEAVPLNEDSIFEDTNELVPDLMSDSLGLLGKKIEKRLACHYKQSEIYNILFDEALSRNYNSCVKVESEPSDHCFERICGIYTIFLYGYLIMEFNPINEELHSYYDFSTNWILPIDFFVKKKKKGSHFLSEIKIKKAICSVPNFQFYSKLNGS